MASKTILKNGSIRVQFRKQGLQPISKTFKSQIAVDAYATRIEADLESIETAEKSKLPVDMAALFHNLHPDLQSRVKLLPVFGRVFGAITSNELTLANLIDKFVYQYNKKDSNILNRLQWWSDHYGHLKINEMTEEYVRHGINTLLTVGSTGLRAISAQTTNRFKANLSSVFEFAKDKYNVKYNPCRTVRGKPEGKGRKRYLSEEEQLKFLQAAKGSSWDRFYLLILMAITTGARRGELEKLRWSNIDFQNSKAFCDDTKNGSDKVIQLTESVVKELKKIRTMGHALVFGHPKRPNSVYDCRKEWDIALKQAGIEAIDKKGEKIVFHSLRHTFCSTLANQGVNVNEIAALAGHKSLQTTMRYTHTHDQRLASVVQNTFGQLQ